MGATASMFEQLLSGDHLNYCQIKIGGFACRDDALIDDLDWAVVRPAAQVIEKVRP